VRVLFVTGEFPPMQGGVGDYTRELGLALYEQGCEVHVASTLDAGTAPGLDVHAGVARWDWSCWRSLLALVRHLQPDVVHVQYQAAAYAMHPAINFWPRYLRRVGQDRQRRLGPDRPRSAVTFHDLKVPYLFPKAGPLRRWVVTELARQSDLVITTNREDFEALERALGRPPALVPIGSNITPRLPDGYDREAWRARWGAGPDDFLLCFFGFINDRKGVDTLLHALALLPPGTAVGTQHAAPLPGTRLLFIGGQTGASDPTNVAYLARIQALVTSLGLEDAVRWTGYLPSEEVSASFDAADLCILPFRDGVSFLHGTLHAALAHGVPVLTTEPRVSLPELSPGENIYLVPRRDPAALADAIRYLAARPDLLRTLGAGARALSAQFRWDTIAAQTLRLYRSL
jgi:glycosyltransferase involved in cell wall biosynthesis